MEDLRTGYHDYGEDSWQESFSGPYSYYASPSPTDKENESLEEKFALYKIQNIVAVVGVLALIIMDVFSIRIGGTGSTEIFEFMKSSLWSDMIQPWIHQFFSR